jgi:L-threonylcarbamoyladenylate synthase
VTGGVDRAVRALERGGVIVFPTDTLYGLGARATDAGAVRRLEALKERPSGMPISLAVSSYEEIEPLGALSPAARAVARRELPGPCTLILPAAPAARRRLPPSLFGHGRTIGVRIPDHPVARELARRVGPITCTSANRHGRPPSRTIAEARAAFGLAVDAYVDGSPAPSGTPSRLLDLTGAVMRVVERR